MNKIQSKLRKIITLTLAVEILTQPILVKSNDIDSKNNNKLQQQAGQTIKHSDSSKFAALTYGLNKLTNFTKNNKKTTAVLTLTGTGTLALLSYIFMNWLKASQKKPTPISILAKLKNLLTGKNATIFTTGAITATGLLALIFSIFKPKNTQIAENGAAQQATRPSTEPAKKLEQKEIDIQTDLVIQEQDQKLQAQENKQKEDIEAAKRELENIKNYKETQSLQLNEQKKALEDSIKELETRKNEQEKIKFNLEAKTKLEITKIEKEQAEQMRILYENHNEKYMQQTELLAEKQDENEEALKNFEKDKEALEKITLELEQKKQKIECDIRNQKKLEIQAEEDTNALEEKIKKQKNLVMVKEAGIDFLIKRLEEKSESLEKSTQEIETVLKNKILEKHKRLEELEKQEEAKIAKIKKQKKDIINALDKELTAKQTFYKKLEEKNIKISSEIHNNEADLKKYGGKNTLKHAQVIKGTEKTRDELKNLKEIFIIEKDKFETEKAKFEENARKTSHDLEQMKQELIEAKKELADEKKLLFNSK